MATKRSDGLYESWRSSTEKFDYFVLGVLGALCAYISQNYRPERIGINPGTLELIALLVLVLGVFFGFRRVEATNQSLHINHNLLHSYERRGNLSEVLEKGMGINRETGEIYTPEFAKSEISTLNVKIQKIEPMLKGSQSKAKRYYKLRNHSMFIGFILLLLAKLYSAYVVA